MGTLPIAARRRLGAAVLVLALASAVLSAQRASAAEPDPRTTTFASLKEAAAAGALDPGLVKPLQAGKPVTMFAVLDGAAAMKEYGNGNPKAVRKAVAALAAVRAQVQSSIEGPVEVLQTYDLVPLMLVRVSGPDVALRMLNLPMVFSFVLDRLNQHWLTASLPLIRQPQAAAMGLTGAGSSVAVLDTGADFTRTAFGNCTTPGTPATCRIPVAVEISPNDNSMDDNGHGTNVAGIVAGVAPGAGIIPIDVFDGAFTPDHDAIGGLNWVLLNRYARNIRAVNMSFGATGTYNTTACTGGPFDRNPYQWAFQVLREAGTLPVVAAGNSAMGQGSYTDGVASPACTPGAVVVGAVYSKNFGAMAWQSCTDSTTAADQITCFSQDGPTLDVLAPGASITAAGFTLGGTSQAAPHVAGAVAVLAQARPLSTADELQSYLTTSSTTVTDSRTGRSHPRLDLVDAARAAVGVPPNDNIASARTLTGWGGQLGQVTWLATKEPGEPAHAGNAGGASVWFSWTATQSGTAFFGTAGSDFDTLLAVYRGNGGTLVPLAANDDAAVGTKQSIVTVPVTAGDTVLVAVDGKATPIGLPTSGNLRLQWNLPNDNFAAGSQLFAGMTPGANISATHEAGEPHHCGDTFAGASVWYRWMGGSGTYRVQAHGTQFLCLAVYTSALSAPNVSQLGVLAYASDDGPNPIDFTVNLLAGGSYWLAVDGVSVETNCNPVTGQCFYTTPTGTFTLTIS